MLVMVGMTALMRIHGDMGLVDKLTGEVIYSAREDRLSSHSARRDAYSWLQRPQHGCVAEGLRTSSFRSGRDGTPQDYLEPMIGGEQEECQVCM